MQYNRYFFLLMRYHNSHLNLFKKLIYFLKDSVFCCKFDFLYFVYFEVFYYEFLAYKYKLEIIKIKVSKVSFNAI